MRIISGKYKSRRIHSAAPGKEHCVKGNISGFRPTTDRAKETLFNTLNNILDFENITSADLFAGSGSLGFEAISRGAAHCHFVESSQKQISMIKKTAAELGCENQVEIFNEDVIRFLQFSAGAEYDLIFADPPYAYENYNELITNVLKIKFGIFVLEYGNESSFMYDMNEYDLTDKKIGAVNFKIFVSKK